MILKGEKFQYFDRFVSCYDLNGISETNQILNMQERQLVFENVVPASILFDYKTGKIGELIELKRKYPLFGKFITFCTIVMNKIDKFWKGFKDGSMSRDSNQFFLIHIVYPFIVR